MSEQSHSNDDTEMSMDEILASIKRYVADEAPETNLSGVEHHSGHTADVIKLTEVVDNAGMPKNKAQFTPYSKVSSDQGSPQQYKSEMNQTFSSSDVPPTKPSPEVYSESNPKTQSFHEKEEYFQGKSSFHNQSSESAFSVKEPPVQKEAAAPISSSAGIISDQAFQATTGAFSKLTEAFQSAKNEKDSANKQSQNMTAIESFVIEMARPMIRQWIDDNLPNLVNKLVTEEIQKLTDELRKKLL